MLKKWSAFLGKPYFSAAIPVFYSVNYTYFCPMFWKIARYLAFVAGLILVSCSEYQKALKEPDITKKYELAERLYQEGDFKRANRLLEQIAPQFVGKPQGERVLFFLADSYYQIKDYNFAGYQFERFLKSYPGSNRADEASFLGAKSYYMLSPKYSLDQTDTEKALGKLQIFINSYPDSEYQAEANRMAQELTSKKENKAFEIAKQYVKLSDIAKKALTEYYNEVKAGTFPTAQHSASMDESILANLAK